MKAKSPLKSPFPYFGGKSRVADLVWRRLGNVDNYNEPFAGSLAVLLRRPEVGKIETVNDKNHFICNFWRAVQEDPQTVAKYADSPVNEADLHARHRWLMAQDIVGPLELDPEWFDAKIAGWWVWGQCCWIGAGWCDGLRPTEGMNMPEIGRSRGVVSQSKQIPDLSGDAGAFGRGVNSSAGHNKRPMLRTDGMKLGVVSCGRPQLGDAFDIGRGVNSNGRLGTCEERRQWLIEWMNRLFDRLRLVRVCYGDWHRICDSKTTMDRLGITGSLIDPPYAKNVKRCVQWRNHLQGNGPEPEDQKSTNRASKLYSGDDNQDIDRLVAEVNIWCQRWGQNDSVRIALCGYEGEHDNLVEMEWSFESWKAQGGYGNRNEKNQNKYRERIWFSPACLNESGLFSGVMS